MQLVYNLSIIQPVTKLRNDWIQHLILKVEALQQNLTGTSVEFIIAYLGAETEHLRCTFDVVQQAYPFMKFVSCNKSRNLATALRSAVRLTASKFIIIAAFNFEYEETEVNNIYLQLQSGSDIVVEGRQQKNVLNRLKGFNHIGKKIFLRTTNNTCVEEAKFLVHAFLRPLNISVFH